MLDQAKLVMKMKKLQKELAKEIIEVDAGDGAVTVKINGEQKKEPGTEGKGEVPQLKPQSVQSTTAKAVSMTVAGTLKNIKDLPQDEQVKVLTEVVMEQGLGKAISAVKSMNQPYLYDL